MATLKYYCFKICNKEVQTKDKNKIEQKITR